MPRMRQRWVRPRSGSEGSLGFSRATRQTIFDVPMSSTERTALLRAGKDGKRGGNTFEFMSGRLSPCSYLGASRRVGPPLPERDARQPGRVDESRAKGCPCRAHAKFAEGRRAWPAPPRGRFPARKRLPRLPFSAASGAPRQARPPRYVRVNLPPLREAPNIGRVSRWPPRLRRAADE